ncbi:rare lipoprotein A [Rhodopseudomonas faecalis]|uniref:Endolytic peptidoglycan transglycosylase RlpA n=1 Tax=Rhodopseudomonas faecalis TaxID=99655 RepID=A0A318TMB3_9BRAD|nr:septal ring lytic transglycosylase RlpA family protein [Rhodopseudomonas faecalis]PYF05000.1 rare lipoprotein A [Rhodopseudomonas faecalis]
MRAAITRLSLVAAMLACEAAEAKPARKPLTSGYGVVSYYSHGNRVASGRRFDPHGMTAAHRWLPFGSRVRITRGRHSIVVIINDRGPFVRGRLFDLSLGAARAIGITTSGVANIHYEVLR